MSEKRDTNYTKHSPGPWCIPGDFREIHPVADEDGLRAIADIDLDNRRPRERESNARLIAAAPELLQALEDLHKQIRNHLNFSVKEDYSLMVADAYASKVLHKIKEELDNEKS
jgi:hypothetical protein